MDLTETAQLDPDLRFGYSPEFLSRMGLLSERLKTMLKDAGFARGAGIRLVTRVAKAQGLRDWPDRRDESDYELLIEAVHVHLQTLSKNAAAAKSERQHLVN